MDDERHIGRLALGLLLVVQAVLLGGWYFFG